MAASLLILFYCPAEMAEMAEILSLGQMILG